MSRWQRLAFRAKQFDPRSIPGLQVWFDATKRSSLTFNGSTISQWNDLSGNGRHATQAVGANQPTYSATSMNGRPGLEFTTSVTNLMDSTATLANIFGEATTSAKMSAFAVMRNLSGSGASFGGGTSPADGRFHYIVRRVGDAGFFDVSNAASGRLQTSHTLAQAEAAAIHSLLKNGGAQTVRYNGVQNATASNTTVGLVNTTALLQIGKSAGGQGGAAVFSELLFYNRALTSTEIATVEKYLARKFGLTI